MTDASLPSIGIIVTAEQIPLLRDIIVAHNLDVYISDTQDTVLLDDQWKPWIRRVRPQRTHCTGAVWLMAPCYSWPDQHSHPRIRTIIAEQLQSCIHMAVMLGATGLVLPIEQTQPAFRARISYYLSLINDQLSAHNLTLMIEIADTVDLDDLVQLTHELSHQYPLLIASHRDMNAHVINSNTICYAQFPILEEEDDARLSPNWTLRYVVGANENVSLIRKNIQWVQALIAHQNQPDIVADEDTESDQQITPRYG